MMGEALAECLPPIMIPNLAEDIPPDFPVGLEPNATGDACQLTLGTHTFSVQAIDLEGNMDPTPATRTWTVVEPTYPETQIQSGPTDPSTDTSATFTFSSTVAGSTFECSLDGAAYAACPSPVTFSDLTVDTHELLVRAIDPEAEVDPTPAGFTWTIVPPDNEAPETTITSGPEDPTNHTDAAIAFSAEPGATYECKLDAGAYTSCASPIGYTGLAGGTHTFSVRATDASGNTDQSPATHTWTVDTTAPDTEITGQPADPSRGEFVSFDLAGSDNHSATGALDFECRLDAGPWVPCAGHGDQRERDLHVLLRRGRQPRVLARRRGLPGLRVARRIQRPGRGRAHVRGAGDRRSRQRGPEPGHAGLDGRPG